MGRSEKGLITSLGLKAKIRPNKYKKVRYAIGNVSKKELSNITREYENCFRNVMRSRGPNMSLVTANFT